MRVDDVTGNVVVGPLVVVDRIVVGVVEVDVDAGVDDEVVDAEVDDVEDVDGIGGVDRPVTRQLVGMAFEDDWGGGDPSAAVVGVAP